MQNKLAEDRCWNARRLTEAIALEFGLQVDEESVQRNLRQLGYAWKRDRYIVAPQPDPQLRQQAEAALGRSQVGSSDESGFGLSLPLGYSWTLKGQPHQREVPPYFGGAGRINLIGSWSYPDNHLQYAVLEGKCTKEAVLAFLMTQAQQASQQSRL